MAKQVVLVLVVVLLAVAAGYGWYAVKHPLSTPVITLQVSETACRETTDACRARHPALGEISLVFPEGAYYLHPFAAQLRFEGEPDIAVQDIRLDLSMPGMDMGRNRFGLKPDNAGKLWQGKLLLPICVTGRKDWQVNVQITAGQQRYEARFPLQVKRYPQS